MMAATGTEFTTEEAPLMTVTPTDGPLTFIPRSAHTKEPRIHPAERARRKKAARVARVSRRKNRRSQ